VAKSLDIVLDRFVRLAGASGIDLATGDAVFLRSSHAGDAGRDRLRAETAARVSSLRIDGMLPLVDYGLHGRSEWVEAYRLTVVDLEGAASSAEPPAALSALLHSAGCEMVAPPDVGRECGVPGPSFVPVPVERVAITHSEAGGVGPRPSDYDGPPATGTAIERRDELDGVVEWLREAGTRPGARLLRVGAPVGAGRRTFCESIARDVRLAGFVPVSSVLCGDDRLAQSGLCGAALTNALRERHVVILEAQPSGSCRDVVRFLSRMNTSGGRAPAMVACSDAAGCECPVSLGPMRAEQLRRSVLYAGIDAARARRAIDEALRRSGGWPGAFASSVQRILGIPAPVGRYRFSRSAPALVREAAPDVTRPIVLAQDGMCASAVARAARLAARGRHATAERLLRRTIGYLQRRRRAADEATVQLALGNLLLERERRAGAREAFDAGRRRFDDARDTAGVVLAMLHLGRAGIEDGALEQAESVLRTAEMGAEHAGLDQLRRASRLLLARCLFWQGRHDAAGSQLESADAGWRGTGREADAVAESTAPRTADAGWGRIVEGRSRPPGLAAVAAEVGVRLALARHDAGLAARRLAAAGEPRAEDGPLNAGTLVALRLLVQGALGDVGGVTATASAGLALMRRLHAPLAAREIRLAHIEALIEARACGPAAACLRKLSGKPAPMVSGLARLRLQQLSERLTVLERGTPGEPAPGADTVDTAAVVRMLQHCHDAATEADAVAGVCQTVRTSLGASAVTAFGKVRGTTQLVAVAGQRASRPDLAERAMDSLLVISPEHSAAGLEAAAPVRYGGAAIGSIVVRWAPGLAGSGPPRVRGVLTAASAAIGPALAAVVVSPPLAEPAAAGPGEVGGCSAAMAEVRRQVARAAAAPYPVLILGESGTGKELIAKAIHAGSARRSRRFCALNCAAVSDDLFEAELFGHARGSFTGASADRPGLFEEADGGTLFLDEVGELSPRAQAKLLRAIQEGEIRRVGENHPRRVDTRIVAATNRPLGEEVRDGRFRRDLLYRLDVVRITVPPLRERPEDIAPLARELWREAMRRTGSRAELSPAALAALARYDWPGNVRELQNTLAALAVQAPASGRVGPGRLPEAIVGASAAGVGEAITLAEARRRFEARFVRATLARAGGRRAVAASALGVSRQGLAKLIARLGVGDALGR
jgi:transcriptional regulator with AAA-type ATPase domain